MDTIGESLPRKESLDKVRGVAHYTGDRMDAGILHARQAISPYAHARIMEINTNDAWRVPGVRAILTGIAAISSLGKEFVIGRSLPRTASVSSEKLSPSSSQILTHKRSVQPI